MPDFTLEALKNEIVNDPETLAYKNSAAPTDWKGDQIIADLGNTKNLIIDRELVKQENIRGFMQFPWYDGLTPDKQEYLRWHTPSDGFLVITAATKLLLTGSQPAVNGVAGMSNPPDSFWLVADRTAAIAAMLPLIEIAAGRFEVLWGEGAKVTASQVGSARNLV